MNQDEQLVREKYPKAWYAKSYKILYKQKREIDVPLLDTPDGVYGVGLRTIIGEGKTEAEAFADAAKKIREVKR